MKLEELMEKEVKSCKYCKNAPTKKVIWADGRAYIPVCDDHIKKARDVVEKDNNDKVEEVINYEA